MSSSSARGQAAAETLDQCLNQRVLSPAERGLYQEEDPRPPTNRAAAGCDLRRRRRPPLLRVRPRCHPTRAARQSPIRLRPARSDPTPAAYQRRPRMLVVIDQVEEVSRKDRGIERDEIVVVPVSLPIEPAGVEKNLEEERL